MKTRLLLLLALLATPAFGYVIKETKLSEPVIISANGSTLGQTEMYKIFADGMTQVTIPYSAKTVINSTFPSALYFRNSNVTGTQDSPTIAGFTNDATGLVQFDARIGSTVDSGTTPAMQFQVRKVDNIGNTNPIATRPIFNWNNFGTDLMTMSAAGVLQVGTITNVAGTGQPAFSQGLSVATAKNISGGATTTIISGNGTTTSPSLTFQADTTTGFARGNASEIDFITAGTNVGNIVNGAWIVGPTAGGNQHIVYGKNAAGTYNNATGSVTVKSKSAAGFQQLDIGVDETNSFSYLRSYNNTSTTSGLNFYSDATKTGGYSAGGVWAIGSTTYTNTPHISNGVIAQATTGTVGGGQANVGTAVFSLNSGSGASAITGIMTVPNITSGNNPLNLQCTTTSSPWGAGSTGTWNCVWSCSGSNPWSCSQSCTLLSGSGTAPVPTSSSSTGAGASFTLTSGQTFSMITMNCVAAVGGAPITWKTTANN